jgi:hypothetical protein
MNYIQKIMYLYNKFRGIKSSNMNFKNATFFVSMPFILSACLGGGGGAGTNLAVIAGLNLPANVEVLQDDSALSGNLAAVSSAVYNDPGTDYTNTKAETWIDGGAWQRPLATVDSLVCIIKNTGASQLPNSTYAALIDSGLCAGEQGSSQDNKKVKFTKVAVVSTRSDNTSEQNVIGYYNPFPNFKYVTETTITEGFSTSNPFGVFAFNWVQADPPSSAFSEKGSVAFTNHSASQVALNYSVEWKAPGASAYDDTQWISGLLNKDGSGGKVKVSLTNNLTSSTVVHKVNFNATHAKIDTDGSQVCKNLDEATMGTYVYGYNLYNTSGALKNLSAGLAFVYGSAKDKRGYAGQYDNWGDHDSDGATADTSLRKWWIWTDDGTLPSTIYKESDITATYSTSGTYADPTINGLTLDNPVNITASFTDSQGSTQTDDLNYEGPGQLWGIDWTGSGTSWGPVYNIADGTSLTATDGTVYKVKQTGMWKTLASASIGDCSSLSVTDADISFTAPTIVPVTATWADKPTITDKPKIIHGVLQ